MCSLREPNSYISVNIALSRPAYQSSNGDNVNRAVDGNKNVVYSGGSCTHTYEEANPWWALDLQWSRLVDRVDLTNRGDCCGM
jgi:hypothetical protein